MTVISLISVIITIIGAIITTALLVRAEAIRHQADQERTRLAVLNEEMRGAKKMLDREQYIPTRVAIEGGYRPSSTPASRLPHRENE